MKYSRSHGLIQAVLLSPFRAGAPHIVSFGAVSHGYAIIPQKESDYGQSGFSNQALRISGKSRVNHLCLRSHDRQILAQRMNARACECERDRGVLF
jgi:hypothetical protein